MLFIYTTSLVLVVPCDCPSRPSPPTKRDATTPAISTPGSAFGARQKPKQTVLRPGRDLHLRHQLACKQSVLFPGAARNTCDIRGRDISPTCSGMSSDKKRSIQVDRYQSCSSLRQNTIFGNLPPFLVIFDKIAYGSLDRCNIATRLLHHMTWPNP